MNREEYYKLFGWKKSPFIKSTSLDVPVIPRSKEYQEICECVGGWDRIIVITAPIGFGKTSFMNYLIKNKPNVDYLVSFDSYEHPEEVMKRIISSLPLHKRIFGFVSDRAPFGEILHQKLGNKKILLVFDEAQDYGDELFKWLRILNDRVDNLFMLFLGLRGLDDKISSESSFRDRKSKSITLTNFTINELSEIVKKRIFWVGGIDIRPFTEDGLKRLCESSNSIPRLLMDHGQRVIEDCAKEDIKSIDLETVEDILGGYAELEEIPEIESIRDAPIITIKPKKYGSFMDDLSPTQQEIIKLLKQKDSLSISEISEILNKDIRSVGSLIRKLRGLNKSEIERKPNVPYPLVIRKGKEERLGRIQYVYSLSDNARRLLANE